MPPQHGAWAFLGLPLVLGALVSGWSWLLPVLALAWLAAYPWSYAVLGLARAGRRGRRRAWQRLGRPLLVWSAVVLPPAVVLVLARPWLVWVGIGYLALFAVNLWFARRRDERSLTNDAVLVLECTAMVPVTWAVVAGGGGLAVPSLAAAPTSVWVLTTTCALVLTGSTLHVKSLIRERDDPRFARASRALAGSSVIVSIGLAVWFGLPGGWWLVVPFVVLAVRAFLARPAAPVRLGLVELGCFLLVAVAAALAVATATAT